MKTNIEAIFTEPAESLRSYRLPSNGNYEKVPLFSSLKVNWNDVRGLGYVQPMPDESDLNHFYSNTYRRVMEKKRGFGHYVQSPNYRAQTQSQCSWVTDIAPSAGKWLDVGAGFGLLLWTAKRNMPNWGFYAVEPDKEAVIELKNIAEVEEDVPGFWKMELFAPNSFDVLTLSHVLEHLTDPIEGLRTLYHYLKPGGCLLIEVPNDHREELTSSSRASDLPHLWFFSSVGLSRMIEDVGFHVERSATLGVKRPGESDSIAVRTKRAIKRKISGPLILLDDPTWYAEEDNRCDLRILARKPLGIEENCV